jgi:hypothetical protein
VIPSLVVFGVGLAAIITPITATVLASVDSRHAGVASGVNNALSRVGQLLALHGVQLERCERLADAQDLGSRIRSGAPSKVTVGLGTLGAQSQSARSPRTPFLRLAPPALVVEIPGS